MFCTKCGHSNPDGAAFCSACGNALADAKAAAQPASYDQQSRPVSPQGGPVPPAPPGQGGYYAPQPPYPLQSVYAPTVKKSKTGLIVGLSVGGFVLIAAVVVLLFVWPGLLVQSAAVNGFWYSEDRGEALEFRDSGSVRVYTTADEFKGDYTYDSLKGMGVITVEDEDYQFAVGKDGLYVDGMGSYEQAKGSFDVDDFIDGMSALNGDVDLGNNDDPAQKPISEPADIPNGNVSGNADTTDIQGIWYETTGYGGTLEFYSDGTYAMVVMGYTFGGTYEYNPSTGQGLLGDADSGDTYEFTLTNGVFEMDAMQYTRDYVEPYDWSNVENVN